MSQVFISYSIKDLDFVQSELLGLIKAIGCEPWHSDTEIDDASYWERTIVEALKASDWFILVMTPNSALSENVKDELNWAINNMQNTIIPIVAGTPIDPNDFHVRLQRIQRIDFSKYKSKARERLIKTLVDGIYKPMLDYVPKKSARITGEWLSFWETKVSDEAEWIVEKLEVESRGSLHSWRAINNSGGYCWSGYGRFKTSNLFVGTWKVDKPGAESSGIGAFFRNPEGHYLVGHWYGPNREGEQVIGKWIIIQEKHASQISVAKRWFGSRVANSLEAFISEQKANNNDLI